MREILFRGKAKLDLEDYNTMGTDVLVKKGEWVYGYYADGHILGKVVESTEDYISFEQWVPVDKNTVGWYTGLRDKSGARIFKDDIIRAWVDFGPGGYALRTYPVIITPYGANIEEWTFAHGDVWLPKKIGNIHDNPELLVGEE